MLYCNYSELARRKLVSELVSYYNNYYTELARSELGRSGSMLPKEIKV